MTTKSHIFECPHCKGCIEVLEKNINCGIFRHAYLKSTNRQIDPHASKIICENLIKEKLIIGCGKPFKIVKRENHLHTEKCEYI